MPILQPRNSIIDIAKIASFDTSSDLKTAYVKSWAVSCPLGIRVALSGLSLLFCGFLAFLIAVPELGSGAFQRRFYETGNPVHSDYR